MKKTFFFFSQKPIDKPFHLCYNIITARDKEPEGKEVNTMNENNTCIFDTYTDADWDALYAAYLEDQGNPEVPETLEWGLR